MPVGSLLIAQPFTKDEYFQPRPSACSYDASASSSSALAPSNYALAQPVARTLGPIVKYKGGPQGRTARGVRTSKNGLPRDASRARRPSLWRSGPTRITAWPQPGSAADSSHGAYVGAWAASHPADGGRVYQRQSEQRPIRPLRILRSFFRELCKGQSGRIPSPVTRTGADGTTTTDIEPVPSGADIQSLFFDMWRTDHPQADLQEVPADMVTSSASGLDPTSLLPVPNSSSIAWLRRGPVLPNATRRPSARKLNRWFARMHRRRGAGWPGRNWSMCSRSIWSSGKNTRSRTRRSIHLITAEAAGSLHTRAFFRVFLLLIVHPLKKA